MIYCKIHFKDGTTKGFENIRFTSVADAAQAFMEFIRGNGVFSISNDDYGIIVPKESIKEIELEVRD